MPGLDPFFPSHPQVPESVFIPSVAPLTAENSLFYWPIPLSFFSGECRYESLECRQVENYPCSGFKIIFGRWKKKNTRLLTQIASTLGEEKKERKKKRPRITTDKFKK